MERAPGRINFGTFSVVGRFGRKREAAPGRVLPIGHIAWGLSGDGHDAYLDGACRLRDNWADLGFDDRAAGARRQGKWGGLDNHGG